MKDGESFVIPNARTVGKTLDYDGRTGEIHVRGQGHYLIQWSMVVDKGEEPGDVMVTLEDGTGECQYACSGAPAEEARAFRAVGDSGRVRVSGHTVLELPEGSVLRMVNRSGSPITLRTLRSRGVEGYSASLTVLGLE